MHFRFSHRRLIFSEFGKGVQFVGGDIDNSGKRLASLIQQNHIHLANNRLARLPAENDGFRGLL